MIHHLYEHNYRPWRSRVRKINGALTYSEDIVKYYIPHLAATITDEYGSGSIVVSTCAPLHSHKPLDVINYHGQFGTLVQWLHSYPHSNPMDVIQATRQVYGHKFERIIFVVAYKEYAKQINAVYQGKGIVAKYLPMRIGTLPDKQPKGPQRRQAVWFGNVYSSKRQTYDEVVKVCGQLKVELLTVREGKMYKGDSTNGRSISQAQAWQVCANAGVVFAVGRCALEAYAMGCEVIIAGDKYGGVADAGKDWAAQEATNFNGRVFTGGMPLIVAIDEMLRRAERGRFMYNQDRLHCETVVSSGKLLWE